MKKILLTLALVFGLTAFAHADVFGPKGGQYDNQTQSYKVPERLSEADSITIEPATVLQVVTNVIDYLGVREGSVYDFKRKEWVAYTGTTLYTKWNVSLDLGMLNADGVGLGLDYNLGALLPTRGIPILQYTQYLYVGGGYGERYNSSASKWEGAPYLGAQFKVTF